MPVELKHMRELLLPGLREIAASSDVINRFKIIGHVTCPLDPLPLPAASLSVAVAMGAAAIIIKNPTVSRRFLPKR